MRDAVSEWQALSALYEQAETLTAPELDLWLERLRREAHPLVAPLRQMLGARAEVLDNGFLSALPELPVAAAGVDDDRAGERIGPYRLLERIGSGGMAEVWRAERDDGAFRRTVAIKLMFRHVGGARGDSFAQRFTRERDILASLDHPNIAGLHDAGVTPGGQPWLALEYVEGEPLTAWCDRARIDVRARVALFRQVLLAVEHAHANLVIHRDLKPANILVSAVGDVRLLDFGIAKLMESEGGVLADTELTRHAGRLMTVAYASPEQLIGRPLTTASDVYSLGVVLYELLCGERPYEVRMDLSARLEQAILETDPRAPSRRALAEAVATARGSTGAALRKTLAPDLDAIVLRALAKQPAHRYGSAEALRAELDRWLAGEPVDARAPSRVDRVVKFARRHPVGASLGSAAVVALMTVAAVAVALGLQAREESARATAARDFMMGMFKQADTDKSHGADVTARELLDRGRDDVLRRLKGQPKLQIDLLEGIAGIQSSMGEVAKSDVTFDELAKLHRRLGDPLGTARALVARAENALSTGRLDLAEALLAEVEALPRRITLTPDVGIGIDLTQGWLALWKGDAARARAVFIGSLARAEKAFGPNGRQTSVALIGIVQSDAALHDFEAALAAQQDLASRTLRASSRTARDVVDLDVGRAELFFAAGRYREAAALEQEVMPRCTATLGIDDASCRRLGYRGVASNIRLGATSRLRAELHIVEAMAKDVSSPNARLSGLTALFQGLSLTGQIDRRPDIVAEFNAVAEGSERTDVAMRVVALHVLAQDSLRKNDPTAAMRSLEVALRLCPSGCTTPGYPLNGTTRMLQGIAVLAQGRAGEALGLLRTGQQVVERELGVSHPLALLFSLNQAVALGVMGRSEEALSLVETARPTLLNAFGTDAPAYARFEALRSLLSSGDARGSTRGLASSTTPALTGAELFF